MRKLKIEECVTQIVKFMYSNGKWVSNSYSYLVNVRVGINWGFTLNPLLFIVFMKPCLSCKSAIPGNCYMLMNWSLLVKHLMNWKEDLKSDSHLPKKIVFCLIESSLKMVKNVFYFVLKAFFVLKIFKFLSQHFGHVGKTAWLER